MRVNAFFRMREKIYLRSATGLNLHLMVSSTHKAERFKQAWDKVNDIF